MPRGKLWTREETDDLVDRLSEGFKTPEIADEFKRPLRSVQSHVQKLLNQYSCYTQAQLVATFLRQKRIE